MLILEHLLTFEESGSVDSSSAFDANGGPQACSSGLLNFDHCQYPLILICNNLVSRPELVHNHDRNWVRSGGVAPASDLMY